MLREVIARFGVQVDSSRLRGFGAAITSARNALAGLAVFAVGRRLIGGISRFITEMVTLGDETAKTARTLGVTGAALQEFQFAAERSGVPAASLTGGLRRLQRNIVDAGEGVDTAVRAFTDLGVSFTDSEGRAREIFDILPELADGFAGLETDSQRSARAQQLFGRSGAQLLPFFAEGSEGIEQLRQRFRELGGGMSADFLSRAEDAQDAFTDWDVAMTGVKTTLAAELLPTITFFAGKVGELVGFFVRLQQNSNAVRGVFIALSIVAGLVFAVMLPAIIGLVAAFVPLLLAIGLTVLALDELFTFLEGGDSVIGRFLDEAFGEGTAESAATSIRQAWEGFARFFHARVIPAVVALIRWLVRVIPPAAAAAARFIGAVGRAVESAFATAVAFVTSAVAAVRRFGAALGRIFINISQIVTRALAGPRAQLASFIAQVEAGVSRITGTLGRVAGFFGIDVPGAQETARQGAQAVQATVRQAPRSAGDVLQEQVNNIVINTGAAEGARELERRVRSALESANATALRAAQRALTQVTESEVVSGI